jgi:hypothetical protein
MADRHTKPPKPEDDENIPPPVCARCGAVITGLIRLRLKATAGEVFTQFRCRRCSERAAAQSAEARDE